MRLAIALPFLVMGVIGFGLSLEKANAELIPNNFFVMEGSGFAVTDEFIQNSQINLLFSTGDQVGSSIKLFVEDGFVTLDDDNFTITELTGSVLREGRFLRLSGNLESSLGDESSLSVFGKLIQNSDEGSVYGFTGRLSQNGESQKVIYTTKILGLTTVPTSIIGKTPTTTTKQTQENEIVIHIWKGSADPASFSYIGAGQPTVRGYYSQDRIIIEPGTTITWINDDDVSHSITSGTGLGSSNRASQGNIVICDETHLENIEFDSGVSFRGDDCTFTIDGRVKSGEIIPGESWSVTIEEPGFYRLADVDYIWMTSTIYAFPSTGSEILNRNSGNPFN